MSCGVVDVGETDRFAVEGDVETNCEIGRLAVEMFVVDVPDGDVGALINVPSLEPDCPGLLEGFVAVGVGEEL